MVVVVDDGGYDRCDGRFCDSKWLKFFIVTISELPFFSLLSFSVVFSARAHERAPQEALQSRGAIYNHRQRRGASRYAFPVCLRFRYGFCSTYRFGTIELYGKAITFDGFTTIVPCFLISDEIPEKIELSTIEDALTTVCDQVVKEINEKNAKNDAITKKITKRTQSRGN